MLKFEPAGVDIWVEQMYWDELILILTLKVMPFHQDTVIGESR